DLGDSLPQFLLQPHDHGHDRARAAGADVAQPDLHDAVGHIHDFDGGPVQAERGRDFFGQDLDHAVFEIDTHGDALSAARRFASATSCRSCATRASGPANFCKSRSRATKSRANGRPYKLPAKPIKCASTLRAFSPNVGFGPTFTAAGHTVPFSS